MMKQKEKLKVYVPQKERIKRIQQQIAVMSRVLTSA